MTQAKARNPSTKAFGAWWDAQGFEMNHQTRAALVAMGQDIARAREVLAVTERRSIEHVFRNEFQVTHVRKSPAAKTAPPKKPEDAIAQSNRVAEIADGIADRLGRTKALRCGAVAVMRIKYAAAGSQRIEGCFH